MSNVYIPKVGDMVWIDAAIKVLEHVNMNATFTDAEERVIGMLQKQIDRREGFNAVVSRSPKYSFEYTNVVFDNWLEFGVPPNGVIWPSIGSTEQIVTQLPMVEKPKQIDKFVITDANLSVYEFCTKYDKQGYMCFHSSKKSKFPAMEVSGDYRLVGTLEVTIFDNSVVYIRQN